jgi:mannosyltransferase
MTDAWTQPRQDAGSRWAFPAVFVVAVLARFLDLGRRSLWTDEGSTWTAASLPLADLVRRCLERDASPPLHYLLTRLAILGGDDEARLRLVPALASLLVVWLTYRLARLALPRGPAAFAALLVALSPYQVMYAQEARTYMTVAAATVAATAALARALTGGGAAAWVLYAVATAAGLWTQSLALLALPAHALVVVTGGPGRRPLRPWLAALAAAGLAYLPWAWASREMTAHLASSHWYIDAPDAQGVFKVLRAVLVSPLPLVTAPPGSTLPGLDAWLPRPLAWAVLALAPLAALALALPRLTAEGARGVVARVAWAAWLVPLLAVFVLSFEKPLFLPRYFVFTTPYLAVLAAFALDALRDVPWARRAFAALAVGTALLGLARYTLDYDKEPWRAVAAHIAATAPPGRTAVLVPYDVDPFAYYNRRLGTPVRAHEVGHPDEPFAARFTQAQLDEVEARARADAEAHDEVWVLVRSANSEVRREVARRAEAAAGRGRVLVERREWTALGGYVRSARFVRPEPAPP